MNTSFKKLKPMKKKRIIDAALEEFSKSGYRKASTNKIVENAGIGKGMLFHYFNSKEELFSDLVQLSLDFIENEFINEIDRSKTDFIERSKRVAEAKMNAMIKNRRAFDFLGNLYLHNFEGMDEKQIKRGRDLQQRMFNALYEEIDTACFREDVPAETIMKLIQWSIDGYQAQLIKQMENIDLNSIEYDKYSTDFYVFLDTLKKIYYK